MECLVHFIRSFKSLDSTVSIVEFSKSENNHSSEKKILSSFQLSFINFFDNVELIFCLSLVIFGNSCARL